MSRLPRLAGIALPCLLILATLSFACDSPPQIVEISPGRGAQEVRTNLPIRIRFDRPVDKQSVAARFSIQPEVAGEFSWERPDTLVYRHRTLATSTIYRISLIDGYRDAQGHPNGFRHSWVFHTERAPDLRTTTPNRGEHGVDPSTYLTLNFSREMLPESLRGAISFSPSVSYSVRGDPEDARRVLVAPKNLLDANAEYRLSISGIATDVDGNHLNPAQLKFTTGRLRPLLRWITFLASDAATGVGQGVWMVDESGFPRVLKEDTADAFTWSPDGSDLMIHHPGGTWTDHELGTDAITLPFAASWAANLGPEAGYAFLDGGTLKRLDPDGGVSVIADDVGEAAFSRSLGRVAFTVTGAPGRGADLRAYDVALRTQYRLQREPQSISGISWDPTGNRVAYIVGSASGDLDGAQLRIKSLTGKASAITVAAGEIGQPVWLPGSRDVTFSARVQRGSRRQWRIFRVNPSLQPSPLLVGNSLAQAIDADMLTPVSSPDGHQIAFLVSESGRSQVWLMNADGTGATRLTRYDADSFPYTCDNVRWSAP